MLVSQYVLGMLVSQDVLGTLALKYVLGVVVSQYVLGMLVSQYVRWVPRREAPHAARRFHARRTQPDVHARRPQTTRSLDICACVRMSNTWSAGYTSPRSVAMDLCQTRSAGIYAPDAMRKSRFLLRYYGRICVPVVCCIYNRFAG